MCTLTYIPIAENDFFFTTNRDESPVRKAEPPRQYELNGNIALYPKDIEGTGTWILCHENDFSVCLLNGAFKKHKHQPPYRKSRGLMVLEFSKFSTGHDFIQFYDFKDIEAFTLLVLRYTKERVLEEIRWDGTSIHFRSLNANQAQIWSSATLYNKEVIKMKEEWFTDWLAKEKIFSEESILSFHKTAGNGDCKNSLVMNRGNVVQTVSITHIRKKGQTVCMHYEDLQKMKSVDTFFNKKRPSKK